MSVETKFDEKVKASKQIWKSKNLLLLYELERRKKAAAERNKGLEPYVVDHEKYKCLTCGNKNVSHPVTSFCFVCDTDNWSSSEY